MSHATNHTTDYTTPRGVPKALYILIVLLLAGLYYFAAYVDVSSPEKTVKTFYESYFAKDYEAATGEFSVFWLAQVLQEEGGLSTEELIAMRAEMEKEVATLISDYESTQPPEQKFTVKVLDNYTKTGEYGGLVVYQIYENDAPVQMEVAILIKEDKEFKIIQFSPIDTSELEMVQAFDMKELDASLKEQLGE